MSLRALKASRTDVEALDLTGERPRRLQDALTEAADQARVTMNRYADHEDADALRSAREDDQRTHHPQQPDPHQGREAGPGH
ncbi:hypothetical protein [Streptomyces sp. NBC_00829]|uniref:hypothetical protein n=1 Tax=Streptomyces sp. NBC_00829 TaxID=2903679 RepID=UPI00386D81D4|nr:hypothetical protein OG293_38075 [Streptomyces sp. NBC_00829]